MIKGKGRSTREVIYSLFAKDYLSDESIGIREIELKGITIIGTIGLILRDAAHVAEDRSGRVSSKLQGATRTRDDCNRQMGSAVQSRNWDRNRDGLNRGVELKRRRKGMETG